MSDIDEIELRRLDLTVLLVFLNLLRLGKATEVAAHMGLTQSSISHSLKRLRDVFQDPLFLRHPKGMEPTAVALALEPRIRTAVDSLSQAIAAPVSFDPATATSVVRIAAYDSEMTALVPGFLEHLRQKAPGLRVSLLPLGRAQALDGLDSGALDLALGFYWALPSRFRATALYAEGYDVVVRQGHPLARAPLGMEAYLAADHLIVSPSGDLTGIVDQELAKQGRSRRVSVAVPQFLPALATIAATDLVATLPRRLVARNAARYGLHVAPPPLEIRPFTVSAIVHERNAGNPLHRWLTESLAAL